MSKQFLAGKNAGQKARGTANGEQKYRIALSKSHTSFLNDTNNENNNNAEYQAGFIMGYKNTQRLSRSRSKSSSRSRSKSRSRSRSRSSNAAAAKLPSPIKTGLVPQPIITTFTNKNLNPPPVSRNEKEKQKYLERMLDSYLTERKQKHNPSK